MGTLCEISLNVQGILSGYWVNVPGPLFGGLRYLKITNIFDKFRN